MNVDFKQMRVKVKKILVDKNGVFYCAAVLFLLSLFMTHTIWYANDLKQGFVYKSMKYLRYFSYLVCLLIIIIKKGQRKDLLLD